MTGLARFSNLGMLPREGTLGVGLFIETQEFWPNPISWFLTPVGSEQGDRMSL
jgi:hypothetical protein